jgi:hypothetical protein
VQVEKDLMKIKDVFSRLRISPHVVPEAEPINHHISYDLARGSCYLILEPKAKFGFEIFASLVKGRCTDCDHQEAFPCESIGCNRCSLPCTCKGCRNSRAQGLCFTLRSPIETRMKYALQTTPIFWISNHGPENVSPVDLEIIADIISKFLKQSKNPVILIDGIEHLIFENGYSPVLKFLKDAAEAMVLQNAIMILPVNRTAIEPKELALMERSMKSLSPQGYS